MTKQDFGDLIISFTDDFYRIAKAILKEDADCEDAMSSAIVKGFSKLHTLKKTGICQNMVFTHIDQRMSDDPAETQTGSHL